MLKDLLKQGDFMTKIDLKATYFCGANKQARQEIPKVQGEKSNVSVQLPTFWVIMRSLGLYQDNQGSSSSPEGDGRETNYVHRRYADHGTVGDDAKE